MNNNILENTMEIESQNSESLLTLKTLNEMQKELDEFINSDLEDQDAIPQKEYEMLAPVILKRYKRKIKLHTELLKKILPELTENLETAEKHNKQTLEDLYENNEE